MTVAKQAAHARGLHAEQECVRLLRAKGYEIIGERVRTEGGELDIVAQKGDTLVVVEVKARFTREAGLYAVTPAKQKRLARGAQALLAQFAHPLNIRFDVMAVPARGEPLHLEDAWRPDEEFV